MSGQVAMRFRWIGLAALLCPLFLACGDAATEPVVVGTNIWPGYEPLYLAQARGLVSGKDIRLIQYPSASEVIRGFHNGVISAAAVTLDEALLMSANGLPIKVVLVFDASRGGDVILGRANVNHLEELAGRKVGTEASALGAFVLCRAAELHGLDCRRDFTVVNLEVNEHENAFAAGAIDAVVTFEPVRTRLIAGGARVLFDSREIPNEIIDVLVVRDDTLARRSRQVRALVRGWFAALDYIKLNRAESIAIMGQREQLSAEQFDEALSGLQIPDRLENLALIGGERPKLLQTAPNLVRIMLEHGLLPRQIGRAHV